MTNQDPGRSQRSPDRSPPHDIEAEEATLGAALLSPNAVETLLDKLSPSDYYNPRNGWIFAAIRSVVAEGSSVDPVTVSDALRRAGTLDDVGGISSVSALMNATPSISNVAAHAKIVADHATLRRLLYASSDIADAAYSGAEPVDALARAQDALLKLGETSSGDNGSTLDVTDVRALLATDLKTEQPEILVRSDGQGLIYAGKLHVLQAEPSSGKSWIALYAVNEILDLGGTAVYLDYEDTPVGVVLRLLALGADPDALAERLRYVRPIGPHGPREQLQLAKILDDTNPDLVVIDGVGESLSRNGLSEDKADDVLRWSDLLPRPIAARGAAVLMIDHVAKDPEHRGRWARGSGAKLGVLDGASYQVKVMSSFSRNRSGAIKLVIAKDRPGGVGAIGETAAIVKVDPYADGTLVRLSIEPDGTALAASDPWKPTHIMERVSREIEDSEVPLTGARVKDLVDSDPHRVSQAIARLLAEGFVAEDGKGRTKTLRSVKRYRAAYVDDDSAPPIDTTPTETALFDPDDAIAEPEWMADERRRVVDDIAKDPNL